MSALRVLEAGLQTTLQGAPRRGLRHLGVPASGPADPVGLALANRAAGNAPRALGLEITLTGAAFRAEADILVAVAGAPVTVSVDGDEAPMHAPVGLRAGQTLTIGRASAGCRSYLALRGGFAGRTVLGSASTYLPAGLGGYEGRASRQDDRLAGAEADAPLPPGATPAVLQPPFGESWTLRAVLGPEADTLDAGRRGALFGEGWRASRAADRVGVRLDGPALEALGDGRMDSAATFPGTVQLPAGGAPILLGVDSGTTGGYPRVAQIVRADRHLIGQIRPGAAVRLLEWDAADAAEVLAEKTALLRDWIGADFSF